MNIKRVFLTLNDDKKQYIPDAFAQSDTLGSVGLYVSNLFAESGLINIGARADAGHCCSRVFLVCAYITQTVVYGAITHNSPWALAVPQACACYRTALPRIAMV